MTYPNTHRRQKTQDLVLLSLFTAIIFVLAFTPLGLIDLPVIKATILHVPVIVASLLLGPKKGAFLGGVFGFSSFLKNTLVPNLSSFVFSPVIPVPGENYGSPLALVVCFVPRILVGVLPWFVFRALNKLSKQPSRTLQLVSAGIAAAVGAFTNTVLVMGMIGLLFGNAYSAANNIPVDTLFAFIGGIVLANGVPEAIAAVVLVPALYLPLSKVVKQSA